VGRPFGSKSRRTQTIFYCIICDSSNLEGQVPVFISPRNRVVQLYLWVPFSAPLTTRTATNGEQRDRIRLFSCLKTRKSTVKDLFRDCHKWGPNESTSGPAPRLLADNENLKTETTMSTCHILMHMVQAHQEYNMPGRHGDRWSTDSKDEKLMLHLVRDPRRRKPLWGPRHRWNENNAGE
jgi:hypothetical protein